MKVFVGFGYNGRDQWIEDQVFPILRDMGFTVVDGKDMHGEILQSEVQSRIEQSDAVGEADEALGPSALAGEGRGRVWPPSTVLQWTGHGDHHRSCL
jgi:hypothetical protein